MVDCSMEVSVCKGSSTSTAPGNAPACHDPSHINPIQDYNFTSQFSDFISQSLIYHTIDAIIHVKHSQTDSRSLARYAISSPTHTSKTAISLANSLTETSPASRTWLTNRKAVSYTHPGSSNITSFVRMTLLADDIKLQHIHYYRPLKTINIFRSIMLRNA